MVTLGGYARVAWRRSEFGLRTGSALLCPGWGEEGTCRGARRRHWELLHESSLRRRPSGQPRHELFRWNVVHGVDQSSAPSFYFFHDIKSRLLFLTNEGGERQD